MVPMDRAAGPTDLMVRTDRVADPMVPTDQVVAPTGLTAQVAARMVHEAACCVASTDALMAAAVAPTDHMVHTDPTAQAVVLTELRSFDADCPQS